MISPKRLKAQIRCGITKGGGFEVRAESLGRGSRDFAESLLVSVFAPPPSRYLHSLTCSFSGVRGPMCNRGLVHMHIGELKSCACFLSCTAGLPGVDFYHAEDGDHEYALLVVSASSCR